MQIWLSGKQHAIPIWCGQIKSWNWRNQSRYATKREYLGCWRGTVCWLSAKKTSQSDGKGMSNEHKNNKMEWNCQWNPSNPNETVSYYFQFHPFPFSAFGITMLAIFSSAAMRGEVMMLKRPVFVYIKIHKWGPNDICLSRRLYLFTKYYKCYHEFRIFMM